MTIDIAKLDADIESLTKQYESIEGRGPEVVKQRASLKAQRKQLRAQRATAAAGGPIDPKTIKEQIAEVDAKMAPFVKTRDEATVELRKLSARRAELEGANKLLGLPESPRKAAILSAAGISSGEAVMTDKAAPGKPARK